MARGRGISQLIIHMAHLTPIGWCYFTGSVLCSAIVYQSSKKVIPYMIRKQAMRSFPSFEWIVIPQYGMSLSFALFFLTSFFLGYFCDSGNSEDDVNFFMIMASVFFVFYSVPYFIKLFKLRCFMLNNGAIFISRFAPLGLYKRIHIDKSSIIERVEGKNNDDPVITFKYNDSKTYELKINQYSVDGQKILRNAICNTSSG